MLTLPLNLQKMARRSCAWQIVKKFQQLLTSLCSCCCWAAVLPPLLLLHLSCACEPCSRALHRLCHQPGPCPCPCPGVWHEHGPCGIVCGSTVGWCCSCSSAGWRDTQRLVTRVPSGWCCSCSTAGWRDTQHCCSCSSAG